MHSTREVSVIVFGFEDALTIYMSSEVTQGGTTTATRTGKLCRRGRQSDGTEESAGQGATRGQIQYVPTL